MIRYLKVFMRGREDSEMYCTITKIMVFGQGMHVVMRNSLMELVQDQKLQDMNATEYLFKNLSETISMGDMSQQA